MSSLLPLKQDTCKSFPLANIFNLSKRLPNHFMGQYHASLFFYMTNSAEKALFDMGIL